MNIGFFNWIILVLEKLSLFLRSWKLLGAFLKPSISKDFGLFYSSLDIKISLTSSVRGLGSYFWPDIVISWKCHNQDLTRQTSMSFLRWLHLESFRKPSDRPLSNKALSGWESFCLIWYSYLSITGDNYPESPTNKTLQPPKLWSILKSSLNLWSMK